MRPARCLVVMIPCDPQPCSVLLGFGRVHAVAGSQAPHIVVCMHVQNGMLHPLLDHTRLAPPECGAQGLQLDGSHANTSITQVLLYASGELWWQQDC